MLFVQNALMPHTKIKLVSDFDHFKLFQKLFENLRVSKNDILIDLGDFSMAQSAVHL